MTKRKRNNFYAIDRVYITYKDAIIDIHKNRTHRTTSGSKKMKTFVNNILWKEKTKFNETIGEMYLRRKNKKKILVQIDEDNTKIIIKRGWLTLRVTIKMSRSANYFIGLCDIVPTSSELLVKRDYTPFDNSSWIPPPDVSQTYVRQKSLLSSHIFNSLHAADI